MPLVLYNSLTRRKEPFVPLDPTNVRMYVCGPTVYDLVHIGNARAVVAFDLLYRVLRHEYGPGHVRYVRNITDVEDKIIAAARQNGEPIDELTRRTGAIFHADMAALGNLEPDVEPCATQYIPQMIRMIERLIASRHAYAAEGHVLFRVASYAKYGQLSRRSRADMLAGARVEVAPYKENPGDFVLWKPSTPDLPGWESPWGRGRPGWHIECSAMSESELGETFDIHGGGLDLIFPHHENEIAQSVCAHDGHPFARWWLHNGMVTVGGAKMAKSEGNFITVQDALKQAPGEVIRLALLKTHYRDPLDWTEDRLHEARQTLDRWYRALNIPPFAGEAGPDNGQQIRAYTSDHRLEALPPEPTDDLRRALEDDLNTPLAITVLHEQAKSIYREQGETARGQLQRNFIQSARVLGLLTGSAFDWIRRGGPDNFVQQIETLIAARAVARREKRFKDADRIRDELAEQQIVLEDRPDGTTDWRSTI
jgi:cysteinyl-tRNA synthetase